MALGLPSYHIISFVLILLHMLIKNEEKRKQTSHKNNTIVMSSCQGLQ